MRKTALYATVSCMLASLLFFLVPVFREAFRVSLAQWHDVLHVSPVGNRWSDPGLESLARKAEQNQDAEALAFVAVRTSNKSESVRLAENAVRLDPTLTWVYGVVAVEWDSYRTSTAGLSPSKKLTRQTLFRTTSPRKESTSTM